MPLLIGSPTLILTHPKPSARTPPYQPWRLCPWRRRETGESAEIWVRCRREHETSVARRQWTEGTAAGEVGCVGGTAGGEPEFAERGSGDGGMVEGQEIGMEWCRGHMFPR